MPNHIVNHIKVEGDTKSIKKLEKTVKGKHSDKTDNLFDFNKIIPMPKELVGTKSPADVISDNEYEAEVERRKKHNEKGKKRR